MFFWDFSLVWVFNNFQFTMPISTSISFVMILITIDHFISTSTSISFVTILIEVILLHTIHDIVIENF